MPNCPSADRNIFNRSQHAETGQDGYCPFHWFEPITLGSIKEIWNFNVRWVFGPVIEIKSQKDVILQRAESW